MSYSPTHRLLHFSHSIIKRYSSFVAFPIKVNGEAVNVVQAIWTKEKTAVTEEQYDDFYRFIANTYDKPIFRLHFRADAPIELKCLFYVPRFHSEKFGMGRTEMGVNLYSRKVLIESKPADLLPEWLRCVILPLLLFFIAKTTWRALA